MLGDREIIRHRKRDLEFFTSTVDDITWHVAYANGWRAAKYPLPAHRYIVMITPWCVEICTGVEREDVEGDIYYDCKCVFYVQNPIMD